jgi:1-deoxy-D-xylulose 5-phosphate reductoisomerase
VAALVAAERAAATQHATGALTASRGLAGLLGQLAACEAAHPVLLA